MLSFVLNYIQTISPGRYQFIVISGNIYGNSKQSGNSSDIVVVPSRSLQFQWVNLYLNNIGQTSPTTGVHPVSVTSTITSSQLPYT